MIFFILIIVYLLLILFITINAQYFECGQPLFKCPFCKALMWYDERVCKSRNTTKPEFTMCCMQGRIEIAPLKKLPKPLYDLYHKNDKKKKQGLHGKYKIIQQHVCIYVDWRKY